MKRLLLFNLFAVVCLLTHAQVTNSFPDIGKPAIGGSNYMSISNWLFFQAKNQTENGNNRGIVANNLYWDSAQTKWTNGTGAAYDFAIMRFESGGNIGFFNGPVPNPSVRQTFTNSELEAYRTLTIKSNGRIGIGTNDPKSYLDIGNASNNVLSSVLSRLPEGNSAGNGTYLGIRAINTQPISSNSFSIEHRFADNLNSSINFYRGSAYTGGFITFTTNNGTEQMRIDPNGNIGIGTTDPKGYKLAVNGPAVFTKAVVKTYANWPDYVFEKDYPLMPLDSVEAFIQANGHLPEIAPADEVSKTGIDLGDNQTKLLQKTEELTLYLIEQNKKIQQLTEENKLLKQQLSQIEEIKTFMAYQQAAIEQLQNESKQTQANK